MAALNIRGGKERGQGSIFLHCFLFNQELHFFVVLNTGVRVIICGGVFFKFFG